MWLKNNTCASSYCIIFSNPFIFPSSSLSIIYTKNWKDCHLPFSSSSASLLFCYFNAILDHVISGCYVSYKGFFSKKSLLVFTVVRSYQIMCFRACMSEWYVTIHPLWSMGLLDPLQQSGLISFSALFLLVFFIFPFYAISFLYAVL